MKEAMILFMVLLLIFIPNVLFKKYLANSGNELIAIVKQMRDTISEQDSINPIDATILKNAFLKKEKKWILFVDHDMLDEIEYEVEDCYALYNKEHESEFISAANRLCDKIEDLAKREEISWGNVL